MVVRLSLGRPAYEAHAALHADALAVCDAARIRFLELADDDVRAYSRYSEARKMPRDTEDQVRSRAAAMEDAARQSTMVPLALIGECDTLLGVIEQLAGRTNVNVASDLDVAALLLEAAARAAAANVIVNLQSASDQSFVEGTRSEVEGRLRRVAAAASRTRESAYRGDPPRAPET